MFNPWVGCSKVSPGCAHCYAETWAERYADGAVWGEDGVRRRTSAALWRKPLVWQRDHEKFEAENGHRRRVFCASLADVFEPRPELEPWRADLFDLIEQTPSLDWLLLTKRPEVADEWLRARYWPFGGLPPLAHMPESYGCPRYPDEPYLLNLWLGTSIENSRFTWRADVLREIPAAVRFISAEPLLGSLYATKMVVRSSELGDRWNAPKPLDLSGIDWVIAGGESGSQSARAAHPDWVREIRDAILAIWQDDSSHDRLRPPAFHFKQWGSYAPTSERGKGVVAVDSNGTRRAASDALPNRDTAFMKYAGPAPTSGGKLLDGVDWCEIPDRDPLPAPVPA